MTKKKQKSKAPIVYKKAIIYCRVSSPRQKAEGHGLESQEQRCIGYAQRMGYEVERVFKDDFTGEGDFMRRPAMAATIKYLDAKPHINFVVIFDDLKRFARDTKFHFKLKDALRVRNAKPECLNYTFGEEPEDEFTETIFAAQAQLERKQNRRQVIQKQRARLDLGYWPFCNPPGLKFIKDEIHGKLLVPDKPLAEIYKEAIEKFANFELPTITSVQEFTLRQYAVHEIKRTLSLNGTVKILKQFLYAGRVGYEPWEVKMRLGHHKGFITWETHLAVQERLANLAKPRLRADYNEDFPLRGYVICPDCGEPPTAGWFPNKRKNKFPYYLCKQKGCPNFRKSILKYKLESEFGEVVRGLRPKQKTVELVEQILLDVWARRQSLEIKNSQVVAKQIARLDEQIQTFMQRIGTAKSQAVITQYESQIEKLATEKDKLEEGLKRQTYSVNSNFERISKVVVKHLQNPLEMWENKDYLKKRLFLGMYFSKGILYDRNSGYQTPEFPLIVKLLTQKHTSKNTVVEMPGV